MSWATTVSYINLARDLGIKCIKSIVVSIVKLLFFLVPQFIGIAPHLIVRDNVLSKVRIHYHRADLLFNLSVVRRYRVMKPADRSDWPFGITRYSRLARSVLGLLQQSGRAGAPH